MPPRLADTYHPGDAVEIFFEAQDEWHPGLVLALEHPGVWVQTRAGHWFVTNARRIRPHPGPTPPGEDMQPGSAD
jgi:hypothetical protein